MQSEIAPAWLADEFRFTRKSAKHRGLYVFSKT